MEASTVIRAGRARDQCGPRGAAEVTAGPAKVDRRSERSPLGSEMGDDGDKARENWVELSKLARESGDQRLILAAEALGTLMLTGLEIADAIDGLTEALAGQGKR
jgi:hypothetical protein